MKQSTAMTSKAAIPIQNVVGVGEKVRLEIEKFNALVFGV